LRIPLSNMRNAFLILMMVIIIHGSGVVATQSTTSSIVGFSVNSTDPHYATIREDGLLEITDYQTSAIIESYFVTLPFQDVDDLDPTGFNVGTITYSPDGTQIAISISDPSRSGIIYLLDWETGQITRAHDQDYIRRVNGMSWNPDGNRIVVALQDGGSDQFILSSVEILNVISGEWEHVLADSAFINNYTFTTVDWSNSNIIAYADQSTLILWDADRQVEIASIDTSADIHRIVWAPDSHHLATLNADRTLQVWDTDSDLSTPQQMMSTITDNFRSRGMTWLDDNLIAVNLWTDIEVWNVANTSLEELIKTDHFIFGFGMLEDNELAFADPRSVNTLPFANNVEN